MTCPLCQAGDAATYAGFPRFSVEECRRCGFKFVDVTAPGYPADAQYLGDEPIGVIRPHQPHLMRRVRDIMRLRPPPATVLDIGCGKGELPLLLAAHGYRAAGLEMKQHYVEYLCDRHPGPRWLSCELAQLAEAGGLFDVISLYHVVEHVAQPLEFLRQVRRLCAPGALIVIEVPNAGGLEARLRGRRWHYYKVDHVSYFTKRDLLTMAERVGWQVLEVKGYQHFSHPQGVWWKDAVKSGLACLGFKDVISIFATVNT